MGILARIGLFVMLIIAIILSPLACTRYDDDIGRYSADVEEYMASAFMPALDSLGEYMDASYYVRRENSLFPCYSIRLIITYEEAEFSEEKERLETAYTYLDEPQFAEFDGKYYTMPLTAFAAAGFDFRAAVFDDTCYPKNFGMVGVSDEKKQIAYLWLYSQDLDYVCEADEDPNVEMIEFLNSYFAMDEL